MRHPIAAAVAGRHTHSPSFLPDPTSTFTLHLSGCFPRLISQSAGQRAPSQIRSLTMANEKTALLQKSDTSLEDPQPKSVSVWELRVLLVPCTCQIHGPLSLSFLLAHLVVCFAVRFLAQDMGTGTCASRLTGSIACCSLEACYAQRLRVVLSFAFMFGSRGARILSPLFLKEATNTLSESVVTHIPVYPIVLYCRKLHADTAVYWIDSADALWCSLPLWLCVGKATADILVHDCEAARVSGRRVHCTLSCIAIAHTCCTNVLTLSHSCLRTFTVCP